MHVRDEAASVRGAASPGATTIARPVSTEGVGVHTGRTVRLALRPAAPGTGIVFHRTDLAARRGAEASVRARFDAVVATKLCTTIAASRDPDVSVGTIEHLMAALAASGIDDVAVDLDGPEVPIGDGSALPFLRLLARAGRTSRAVPARVVAVRRPVRVETGDGFACLLPDRGFALDVSIDFPAPAIGRQSFVVERLTEAAFERELAAARTFALAPEIEALRAAGLARGGSLGNAVVVDGDRVLNPDGLRMRDEFVRHKALDAVGDLALAGARLQARYVGHRAGHALNNLVLRALFADPANWREAAPAEIPDRRAA